jgi:3-oxoacyl-(acyl-carrier-protein) synthase
MSTDAYDLTSPRADGRDVILCMESALREALIKADDVDLVNAHVRVARFPNPTHAVLPLTRL